jgi:hypothetical protein
MFRNNAIIHEDCKLLKMRFLNMLYGYQQIRAFELIRHKVVDAPCGKSELRTLDPKTVPSAETMEANMMLRVEIDKGKGVSGWTRDIFQNLVVECNETNTAKETLKRKETAYEKALAIVSLGAVLSSTISTSGEISGEVLGSSASKTGTRNDDSLYSVEVSFKSVDDDASKLFQPLNLTASCSCRHCTEARKKNSKYLCKHVVSLLLLRVADHGDSCPISEY